MLARSVGDTIQTFTLAPGRYAIEISVVGTRLHAKQTFEVAEIPLDAEDAGAIDLTSDPRVVQVPLR